MYHVFLSHISEESRLSEILKEWIESTFSGQCNVFVSSSKDDISAGEKWLDQIDTALKSAKIALVLCSLKSLNRPWINFETGCAWSRKIHIIPICHSSLKKEKLPQPLAQFQALEIENKEFSKLLIGGIAKILNFNKLPRISYDHMTKEIKEAEMAIGQIDSGSNVSSQIKESISEDVIDKENRLKTTTKKIGKAKKDTVAARIVFAKELDSKNNPVNTTSIFSIVDHQAYFYIYWFDLIPFKEYLVTWRLYDENGELMTMRKLEINPEKSNWQTWSRYTFDRNIDKPGKWNIIVKLNNEDVVSKTFEVK